MNIQFQQWIRLDRERTKKMVKERDAMLGLQMKEIENRGQIQKMVEIDVDWVFRLNQLYYQPISLREKEQQKKATGTPSIKIENFEEMEESVGESTLQVELCFHRYRNCYSKGYYDYQICLISLKRVALDDF